jgi:hypothetical protein
MVSNINLLIHLFHAITREASRYWHTNCYATNGEYTNDLR